MKWLISLSLFGLVFAAKERRFLFQQPDGTSPFQGSPFGGDGGMISPFGGATSGGSGSSSGSYTPCTPSQMICPLHCENGYVQGPGGCHFCQCSLHAQTDATTTHLMTSTTKVTTSPVPVDLHATSTVLSAKNETVDCMTYKVQCATSCGAAGYLIDPSDCTFCMCKDGLMS